MAHSRLEHSNCYKRQSDPPKPTRVSAAAYSSARLRCSWAIKGTHASKPTCFGRGTIESLLCAGCQRELRLPPNPALRSWSGRGSRTGPKRAPSGKLGVSPTKARVVISRLGGDASADSTDGNACGLHDTEAVLRRLLPAVMDSQKCLALTEFDFSSLFSCQA
ncbi:hypothetical protein MRX96_044695 [Rhipicephalus microplus]